MRDRVFVRRDLLAYDASRRFHEPLSIRFIQKGADTLYVMDQISDKKQEENWIACLL